MQCCAPLLTHSRQALPIWRHSFCTCPRIPPDHSHPRQSTTSDTGYHTAGIIHSPGPMAHSPHRDINSALWPCCECEWQLPDICSETAIYGHKCGDVTIPDTNQYLQLLESSIFLRGGGNSALPLHDGTGLAGRKG